MRICWRCLLSLLRNSILKMKNTQSKRNIPRHGRQRRFASLSQPAWNFDIKIPLTAPNAYPFLDVYRKYRKLEEITRPMVVELIEKIEVYEGNRVEITFRFQDEIADLLEELHQKQMGQHEVSA